VPAYGFSHAAWLTGIAGVSATLSYLCRRERISRPLVRAAVACFLVAVELERAWRDGLHFPDRMPFNLCNISTWMAVLACATLAPLAVEWVYYLGFAGAAMALLMPDMGDSWPPRFFLNHGGIVVAASTLVFGGVGGRVGTIRSGAVWRCFGLLLVYAALVGTFDRVYGMNYGYLCSKPEGVTLMNLMGPWPFYLFWTALLALGLFGLMELLRRRIVCTRQSSVLPISAG
jgi:hypothetical integral membrane protein (TIGR02206 family)